MIAVELQAHGHAPDVDRPLTVEHVAADVVELLDQLGVERADVYRWSMGASVAQCLGTDHPDRVGRLVPAAVSFDDDGLHPGLLDWIQDLQPEHLHGSEFHEEYLRTAPDPAGWANLVTKMKVLDASLPQWTPEQVRALPAPTMIVLADLDFVQPEHAVRMFRLLGGAAPGDLTGVPTGDPARHHAHIGPAARRPAGLDDRRVPDRGGIRRLGLGSRQPATMMTRNATYAMQIGRAPTVPVGQPASTPLCFLRSRPSLIRLATTGSPAVAP
nr:alpha/beta hydrolase [Micromonospora sp. NBC_00855]